ncbi:ABC transporter permease subunit [Limnoraphis robusta Tam1]|uniref:amino acid ABC transporter permease n=1 Tax=Limnoraphis robusta TaxID=1118279 RepID=UPI002B1FD945|nr:ABC transporter permease subunit [Limnoraphis robusta]MEA5499458.1 ABC transporter permease subunit [Limnoraphis robusta BA-68 BA1]MEA5541797.1 ABC transporter permease subunit [Limnoraphis robusta Tam1]
MTMNTTPKTPLWRDDRFWKIALQVIVLIAVLSLFTLLGTNLSRNLQQTGGTVFNFNFLNSTAGFGIGESLIPYQPTDNYSQVLLAGLINSLRVMFFGMILTTLLGVTAGITYFSDNWLLRQMTVCYVEVVRNTPLLLQLMFWYGIFLKLPSIEQTARFFNFIYLNQRGVFVPWPSGNAVWFWLAVLLISAIASILIWRWRTKIMVEQGKSGQPQLTLLWIIGIAAIFIIIFGLGWQRPMPLENGRTIEGGLRMTIEFTTLLVGLVVYTGAYIAEIVRSGIQSVAKGQWEAARSLGLRPGLVMRLVVFPQALRVIIPPLNSQYLNLAKNSSLAIAVAYPDIYSVANTTFNQSGRVVEVMLIIMATYLTIDLLISIAMNGLNRAVQLRER